MAITPTERNAVLGRLARSDVVSLTDRRQAADYDYVESFAVKRLVTQGLSNDATADLHYGAIVKLLEDARLTISIKSPNWFYSENKSKTYGSFWERGVSGASNDAVKRDSAENSMFGYGEDVITDHQPTIQAQNRVMNLGVRVSNDFQPAMRPRYAAVDFGQCVNGALSKYGKSFFVLKSHLKLNATYTHCDSFEVDADLMGRKDEYFGTKLNLRDVTASYTQLGYIVAFCHPRILGKLHSYALGLTKKGSEQNILGGLIYIEAQLHADIMFSRDVEELRLSIADTKTGPIPHPKSKSRFGKKTIWDAKDEALVKKNAQKFARDNGIKYVEVP